MCLKRRGKNTTSVLVLWDVVAGTSDGVAVVVVGTACVIMLVSERELLDEGERRQSNGLI